MMVFVQVAEVLRNLKNLPLFLEKREERFDEIINQTLKNNKSNYDCIVPVSGGKDSYYQTHVMVSNYGLKPLYNLSWKQFPSLRDYNRDKNERSFNADHIVYGPSIDVLKKLNRIGFKKMGDMNWHAHCGIFTTLFS